MSLIQILSVIFYADVVCIAVLFMTLYIFRRTVEFERYINSPQYTVNLQKKQAYYQKQAKLQINSIMEDYNNMIKDHNLYVNSVMEDYRKTINDYTSMVNNYTITYKIKPRKKTK